MCGVYGVPLLTFIKMDFSSQAMLLQNAQWPYSFPYKSYDFGLHPAFLQSAYRPLPNTQYGGTTEQTERSHTVTQKVDKFSIDAILKKDKSDEKDIVDKSESVNQQDSPKSATDEMELACRRYQRLYEIGHPYISQHQQTGAEKSYLHKHLHTFKQFSDRSRAGKWYTVFGFHITDTSPYRNCQKFAIV